jgi:hypothetical protein
MSARSKLEQHNARLTELGKQFEDVNKEISKVDEQRMDALRDLVHEEQLLSQIEWEVDVSFSGKICLVPTKKSRDKAFEVSGLFGGGWYHFSFDFNDAGCSLRADDNDISIIFSPSIGPDEIVAFIENNNITVLTTKIDKEIEKLDKKSNALKAVREHFVEEPKCLYFAKIKPVDL